MTLTPTPDTTRAEFIEKIGLVTQNDGLPRIAGRVLGMLLFDGATVSFGDLAEGLQVSRGSISSATRILQERGLIKRVGKAGQRQDFFQIAENPFSGMLDTVVGRLSHAKAEVDTTLAQLGDDQSGARQRLETYANFYAVLHRCVASAADELR